MSKRCRDVMVCKRCTDVMMCKRSEDGRVQDLEYRTEGRGETSASSLVSASNHCVTSGE